MITMQLRVTEGQVKAQSKNPRSRQISYRLIGADGKPVQDFSPSAVAPKMITASVKGKPLAIRVKSSGSFQSADIQSDSRAAIFDQIWNACTKTPGTVFGMQVSDLADAKVAETELASLDLELE